MSLGKILMLVGLVLFGFGLLLGYAPGLLAWFGKLPGDIRIERENGVLFIPLTSMLLISLVLSILLSLFFRR